MTNSGVLTTALVRDFLVEEGLCDTVRALRLADRFERYLRGCDWIETSDGITFERAERRARHLANQRQRVF